MAHYSVEQLFLIGPHMPRAFILSVFLLLGACANRTIVPYGDVPAGTGTQVEILTVTNRGENEFKRLSSVRGSQNLYIKNRVSIPPRHKPGAIEVSHTLPDPSRHFVMAQEERLADGAAFARELKAQLAKQPKGQREILLYVHGYNNSYVDGLFRIAQLKNDLRLPGVMVHYSWPSAANPLGYSHDRDSVLFARDDLQETLERLRRITDAPILLVAHSMGSFLLMETLRQKELTNPGWSKRKLNGVVLIAPDISIDVFKSQAARFKSLPQPFAVFSSRKDPALRLSARLNNVESRLGNIDEPEKLGDLPVIVFDVTNFSESGRDKHFVPGTSPAMISLLRNSVSLESAFRSDPSARGQFASGTVVSIRKATRLILSPGLVVEQ